MDATNSLKKWINILIVVFLTFGFGQVVPPFSTITETGMKILGPFLGMVYGWCTLGMGWPSILCMVGISYSGSATIVEVCAGAIGNHLLLFLILMMIIVENLTEVGFTSNLALWIITRKSIKGKPWLLLTIIFLVTYLLAAFCQAFATIFLMWSFWYVICRTLGYQPFTKFVTAVITGTILSVVMGSLTMPFHQLPLVLLGMFSNLIGEPANYISYMAVAIPFTLICIFEYILILKYVVKLDVSKLETFDTEELLNGKEIKFTKKQIYSCIVLLVLIAALILPSILPKQLFIVRWLAILNTVGVAMMACIVMMWIKVDGEPLLDLGKAARNGINWDVVFFFAMVMYVPGLLTAEGTGVSAFLTTILQPLVAGKSPIIFCFVLFLAGTIITNFFNNTITAILLMQVLVSFSSVLLLGGISPWAVVTILIIATNMAFWTPVACPTAGLLYGNEEWVKKGEVFKLIFPTSILWIITMLAIAFPLANTVFSV